MQIIITQEKKQNPNTVYVICQFLPEITGLVVRNPGQIF